MNLVADIGNTNIKIGVFENDKLVDSTRLATSNRKTADEYWLMLKDMFKGRGISSEQIDGAIMSSVNPNLNYTIEHMIRYNFGVTPMVVGAGIKTGLKIKYDNPKEVGSDRIVGAVAAYRTYGGPVITIDCGTATTFNVVNEKGEFLGGCISFGLKTAADSLSSAAARLPNIELNVPPEIVNRNTISNMQAGIIYGFVGLVEKIVNKIKSEIGQAKVVATGGLSEIIIKHTDVIDAFDKTLTLRGLNIIYNMNKQTGDKK